MSEIEKMYKNTGIKNELQGFHCHRNLDICENEHKCKICKHSELIYSTPFTTEKQIELIKLLTKKEMLCRLEDEYPYFERFKECIAYIINYLWQDLTSEEKQQIKEILE